MQSTVRCVVCIPGICLLALGFCILFGPPLHYYTICCQQVHIYQSIQHIQRLDIVPREPVLATIECTLEDREMCSICLEFVESGYSTRCPHKFHKKCMDQYLQHRDFRCPTVVRCFQSHSSVHLPYIVVIFNRYWDSLRLRRCSCVTRSGSLAQKRIPF